MMMTSRNWLPSEKEYFKWSKGMDMDWAEHEERHRRGRQRIHILWTSGSHDNKEHF